MEHLFPVIDKWLFDYLTYKYVVHFLSVDPLADSPDSAMQESMKGLLHESIKQTQPNQDKAYLLLIVFTCQEMENICMRQNQESSDNSSKHHNYFGEVLSQENFTNVLEYLSSMETSFNVFYKSVERESIKKLVRKSLLECIVMRFQFHLKSGNREAAHEVVGSLQNAVSESDNPEEQALYEFCCNLNPSSGKYKSIAEFVANVRQCVEAINSLFEIPKLIQFAISSTTHDSNDLERLYQDRRPSRRSDLMKFCMNDELPRLTDSRKKELRQMAGNKSGGNSERNVEDEETEPVASSDLSEAEFCCSSSRQQSSTHGFRQGHKLKQRKRNHNLKKSSAIHMMLAKHKKLRDNSEGDMEEEAELVASSNSSGSESEGSSFQQRSKNQSKERVQKLKLWTPSNNLRKLREIDLQIVRHKAPPSHTCARLGPWLPEEEHAFVEETLKIGVGKWLNIKEKLGTARSTQQLKDKWRNIKPSHIRETAKKLGLKHP